MKRKSGNILITIGLLLIGAALLVIIYNTMENQRALKKSKEALVELREQISVAEKNSPDNNTVNDLPLYESYSEMAMPEIIINGDSYIGILKIPSLNLELPVKGDFSYPALTTSPCRYYGSVYMDNMIVAGHNYGSHFGWLGRLKIGDNVSFTDGDGNEFLYAVSEILQIDGRDAAGMKSGECDLTLFTCTVSGKSRLTIRLDRINV